MCQLRREATAAAEARGVAGGTCVALPRACYLQPGRKRGLVQGGQVVAPVEHERQHAEALVTPGPRNPEILGPLGIWTPDPWTLGP